MAKVSTSTPAATMAAATGEIAAISVEEANEIMIEKFIQKAILAPFFTVLILLTFGGFVNRYILNGMFQVGWIEEISIVILVWLIYLGFYVLYRARTYIILGVFRTTPVTDRLSDLFTFLFFLAAIWFTVLLLPPQFRFKFPASGWPRGLVYVPMLVLGGGLIAAIVWTYIVRRIRSWKRQ